MRMEVFDLKAHNRQSIIVVMEDKTEFEITARSTYGAMAMDLEYVNPMQYAYWNAYEDSDFCYAREGIYFKDTLVCTRTDIEMSSAAVCPLKRAGSPLLCDEELPPSGSSSALITERLPPPETLAPPRKAVKMVLAQPVVKSEHKTRRKGKEKVYGSHNSAADIEAIMPEQHAVLAKPASKYSVGQRVKGKPAFSEGHIRKAGEQKSYKYFPKNYNNQGRWFIGRILEVTSYVPYGFKTVRTYTLMYDDGDIEWGIKEHFIRAAK